VKIASHPSYRFVDCSASGLASGMCLCRDEEYIWRRAVPGGSVGVLRRHGRYRARISQFLPSTTLFFLSEILSFTAPAKTKCTQYSVIEITWPTVKFAPRRQFVFRLISPLFRLVSFAPFPSWGLIVPPRFLSEGKLCLTIDPFGSDYRWPETLLPGPPGAAQCSDEARANVTRLVKQVFART
jgi:hypothetical protein